MHTLDVDCTHMLNVNITTAAVTVEMKGLNLSKYVSLTVFGFSFCGSIYVLTNVC